MSTPLVKIKALKKSGSSIFFQVKIINPEEYYFYEKKNFALQILWEPVQLFDQPDSPLAKEISVDAITDEQWVLENQEKFISNIKITSTKNYPGKDQVQQMNRESFDEFRKKHGIPEAELQVDVTDKKWHEHIKEGMEWESASYDMEP